MAKFSFDSFFSWLGSLLHYHFVVLLYDLDTVKDVTLYGIDMDDLLKKNSHWTPEKSNKKKTTHGKRFCKKVASHSQIWYRWKA